MNFRRILWNISMIFIPPNDQKSDYENFEISKIQKFMIFERSCHGPKSRFGYCYRVSRTFLGSLERVWLRKAQLLVRRRFHEAKWSGETRKTPSGESEIKEKSWDRTHRRRIFRVSPDPFASWKRLRTKSCTFRSQTRSKLSRNILDAAGRRV